MELKESRKHKKRAKRAEQTRLFADTKQERRILKDKESVGDPAADAQRLSEAHRSVCSLAMFPAEHFCVGLADRLQIDLLNSSGPLRWPRCIHYTADIRKVIHHVRATDEGK